MKVGILLSGSGVYDGSEIQEAVFALLAVMENGAEAVCFAPDIDQHHVINHITGEEMNEQRNVLLESARIARGNIKKLTEVDADMFDVLVIPGGFGAAKNINKWALSGPDGELLPAVKNLILAMVKKGKPIAALCMGPTIIAKALQGAGINATLTVGTTEENSPYDIQGIIDGMQSIGVIPEMKTINEISVDMDNKIVSAPCYMMDANILEVRNNIKQVIDKAIELI